QQLDTAALEHRKIIAKLTQLPGADTGEGKREEHDRDRPHPTKGRQPHGLTELVHQLEIGCNRIDIHHYCVILPMGPESSCEPAAQFKLRLTSLDKRITIVTRS